jgi:hypothetical protein
MPSHAKRFPVISHEAKGLAQFPAAVFSVTQGA